jgi:hypothetical protein
LGAWGAGSFDNDAALDWVAELEGANSLDVVRAALGAAVLPDEVYLEVDEASAALAAAEVVAGLRSQPAAELPVEVRDWVAAHPQPVDDDLRDLALRALQRVTTDSELSEL